MFFAVSSRPRIVSPRSPFFIWTLGCLLAAVLLALASPASAATRIIYVSPDGTDSGGTSWAGAYTSLQSALTAAETPAPTLADPVEIWIKTGVYKPTTGNDRFAAFALRSYLTLRGGFVGNESDPSARPAAATATAFTVLSGDIGNAQVDTVTSTTAVNSVGTLSFNLSSALVGGIKPIDQVKDNSYNVLRANGAVSVTLDRLVVAGGYADSDAVSALEVETMLQPSVSDGGGYRLALDPRVNGGALYAFNAGVDIVDCWFVGNYAEGMGGAISARGGYLNVQSTKLVRNFSGVAGGAVGIQSVSVQTFADNTLYANIASQYGGALFVQADSAKKNVKGYIGTMLNSFAAGTYVDPTPVAASESFYNEANLKRSGLALGQTIASAIIGKGIATASSGVIKALLASTKGFTGPYAIVSGLVTLADFGVQLAVYLGVDPNNPIIQGYTVFSNGFAAYATPLGLSKTIIDAIFGDKGPSFETRATDQRKTDYANNQNLDGLIQTTRNRFEKNYSAGLGGAVAVIHANVSFDRSFFVENKAAFSGGAVLFAGYNHVDVENSVFLRNEAKIHSAVHTTFRSINRLANNTLLGNRSYDDGRAIGIDVGADVILANSILWSNSSGPDSFSNPYRSGGADIFAARKADLDTNGTRAYNDAGDSHGLWTGVCDIRFCNIQSLDALVTGTVLFKARIPNHSNPPYGAFDSEIYDEAEATGTHVMRGYPNVGEGIRPDVRDASKGNISRDPALRFEYMPIPPAPGVDAGGVRYLIHTGEDLLGRARVRNRVDIGAIESDYSYPGSTTLHVNAAVSASGDGLSWATAFKTLREALDANVQPESQIWVAQGVYPVTSGTGRGPATLRPGLSLIGGFPPTGNPGIADRNRVLYPVTLTGNIGTSATSDNSYALLSGVTASATAPRLIDGIIFSDTAFDEGECPVRLAAPAILKNCVFKNNASGDAALVLINSSGINGFGSGKVEIFDCLFENNAGGGIESRIDDLTVVRTDFYNNTSPQHGGGLMMSVGASGSLTLERCVFFQNVASAGRGGGVYYLGRSLSVAHCVFADNTASVPANDNSGNGGAGLYWTTYDHRSAGTLTLVNSVLYGNRVSGVLPVPSLESQQFSLPSFSSNNLFTRRIAGNDIEGLSAIAPRGGTDGNVDYDPFFVNKAAHDFSVTPYSMLFGNAVAYGSGTETVQTVGAKAEIGARETTGYDGSALSTPLTFTALAPTETALVYTLAYPDITGPTAYAWEVLRPGAGNFVAVVNDAYTSGTGTVKLTFTNPPRVWNGSIYRVKVRFPQGGFYSGEFTLRVSPAVLYVKPSASGTGDGGTWADATTLSDALSFAASGTQVRIAKGAYAIAPVELPVGVRLYGGFVGTETQLDPRAVAPADTVITVTGSTIGLNLRGTSVLSPTFDNLTFRASLGANPLIQANGAAVIVKNVRFEDISQTALKLTGGSLSANDTVFTRTASSAVRFSGGVATFLRAQFISCGTSSVSPEAGALFLTDTNATVIDSRFEKNYGVNGGAIGAFFNADAFCEVNIVRSVFTRNEAKSAGGALFARGVAIKSSNSLFVNNRAPDGTAAASAAVNYYLPYYAGSITLVHATVVQDAEVGPSATFKGAGALTNSLVYNNNSPLTYGADVYTLTKTYLYGSRGRYQNALPFETALPLFADVSQDDYRLLASSPLRDIGGTDDSLSGTTDLLGNPRRHAGGQADIGCYEFAGASSPALYLGSAPGNVTVYENAGVSFSANSATHYPYYENGSFAWEYYNGSAWRPISEQAGWFTTSYLYNGGGYSLFRPATTGAMNGQRLRAVSSQAGVPPLEFTITFKPRDIFRVNRAVGTSGDGKTWAGAFKTIGEALAVSHAFADIWIAGGDYPETSLGVPGGARLYTGFAGGETVVTARDNAAHPVRLIGAASSFTLDPADPAVPPAVAFNITAAPQNRTVYAARPVSFTVNRAGGAAGTIAWQYRSGSAWLPIANLAAGWTVSANDIGSTLSHISAPLANLELRAVFADTPEASFTASLEVKPRVVRYVDHRVAVSGNGLSWPEAYKTLGEALAASDEGTDLWIVGGSYSESDIRQIEGLRFFAGFVGDETSAAARDAVANPVHIVSSGGQIDLDASTAGPGNFQIAGSPRSRRGYVGQPASFSASRAAGSTATLVWEYLSGTDWLPFSGLPGWTITTRGATTTLARTETEITDNFQLRVSVPGTTEHSFIALLVVAPRTIRYVSQSAPNPGDGSSWDTAYPTIQAALEASDNGSDLWIAAGTYFEPLLTVVPGANLFGGFAGWESSLAERDLAANLVTIQNLGTGVLQFNSGLDYEITTIDNIRVAGTRFPDDNGTGPAAVIVNDASPLFNDFTLDGNYLGLVVSGSHARPEFTAGYFVNNAVAIQGETGVAIAIATSRFDNNARGLVLAAGSGSSVADSVFEMNQNGIESAPGLVLDNVDFVSNARSVTFSSGYATSLVSECSFQFGTEYGVQSASPVRVENSTFSSEVLGISVTNSDAARGSTVTDCVFSGAGQGIRSIPGLTVRDSTFTGLDHGLAIEGTYVSTTAFQGLTPMERLTFTGLTGPAVTVASGDVRADRFNFTANTGAGPLVATTAYGIAYFTNARFTDNVLTSGPVISGGGNYLILNHLTVANNQTGASTSAIARAGGSILMSNSIIWGNRSASSVPTVPVSGMNGNFVIRDSIVENLRGYANSTVVPYDPLFVDPFFGDFTLQPLSPALDAAPTQFITTALDLAGQPRVQSSAADLGAYESTLARAAAPVRISYATDSYAVTTGDIHSWTATMPATAGQTLLWQVDRGFGFEDLVADSDHVLTPNGDTLTLTVFGQLAFNGYRYRAVVSDGATVVFGTEPATYTVNQRPVIHVDANASEFGLGDGTTWFDAYPSLATALANAPTFADIHVAAGTYVVANAPIRRGQRLEGGWDSLADSRDVAANPTLLTSAPGATATSVILASDTSRGAVDNLVTLDGFTFTAGGRGLLLTDASPVVTNCRFENLLGNAVVATRGAPRFESCDFTGNQARALVATGGCTLTVADCDFIGNAGAIQLDSSNGSLSATVSDSTFTANTAVNGGAIVANSPLTVLRSTFTGNTASGDSTSSGGAINANTGNAALTVRDSLFARNTCSVHAGAIYSYLPATLTHLTVADNQSGKTGSALEIGGGSVRNSILWGNTSTTSPLGSQTSQFSSSSSSRVLENNIIQGLYSLAGSALLPFAPHFVDAANGDYRLASDSPAIDAGLVSAVLTDETDLLGNARLQSTAPDLGAFESADTASGVFDFDLPATLSGPPQSSFTLTQTVPVGFTGSWQYLDGAVWRDFGTQIPAAGPANVVSGNFLNYFQSASNQAVLKINQIVATADGRQLRFRLVTGSVVYVSAPITISVTPFEIIYVDPSASAGGDGESWSTAYQTFAEALAHVSLSRRVIHLAEGEQRGPFSITKRLEVYGGFPAGGAAFADRDPANHPTVLTGLPALGGDPRATTVVTFTTSQDVTETVLDGVTVSDGQTGLLADGVSPVLRNLVVTGHTATGLVLNNSSARLESSRLENNAGVNGGAIRLTGGAPVLDRLILRANTATANGGAIHATSSFALTNSLLSGNVADLGAGLYVAQGYPTLSQVTVAGNRARASAAIHAAGGTVALRNSIVWGNVASETSADPQLAPASGFALSRVTVEQTAISAGVLTNNPWFISPVAAASAPTADGDYRLAEVSPARDTGDNAVVASLALDLDGEPRVASSTVDLGAYEASDAPSTPFAIGAQPAAVTFRRDLAGNTFTVSATGATAVEWQITDANGDWVSLLGNPAFSGADSATLTVLAGDYALNGRRVRAVLSGPGGLSLVTAERALTVYSPRYYVNASAAPGGDGLTWATAFQTLGALPYDPEGTEVWMAAGVYAPATVFRLNAGLSIYGGFAGGETSLADRDPAANVTALVDASGQPAVVALLSTNPAGLGVRLDGLVIRDSSGLGIDNTAGRSLTLENVRLTGLARALDSRGGALVVRHSEFRGNGGASLEQAPFTAVGGTILIENTLFAGNRSNYYSAAYLGAPSILRHVTFAANYGRLDALSFSHTNNQTYNCVFWGNRNLGNTAVSLYGYGLYVGRNNVIENYNPSVQRFSVAAANSGADPKFVSPVAASSAPVATGDYRLGDTSLAIDAGTNSETTVAADLAGSVRQSGLFVDPGAYENQAAGLYSLTVQPADAPASDQTPAVFTVAASRPATFVWEVSTDSGANYAPVSGATAASLSIPGSLSVNGRLYRARVQFTTGPELVSDAAQLAYLNVAATADASAGFATAATFSSSATAPVTGYQWQVKIGSAAFADLSGETASSLSVLGDASFANRSYRVRATFASGPALVSNAVAFTYAEAAPSLIVATPGALDFALSGGVAPASLTDASLAVHAAQTGRLTFADSSLLAPSFNGDHVTLAVANALHAGERAQVTLTSALRRTDGIGARPRVFEFRQPTLGGIGVFDTPAALAPAASAFALGDLDADDSIDALVATPAGLQLFVNDGLGAFAASGSPFGPADATALALGSLSADAALDVVAVTATGDLAVYLNDGLGAFTLAQTIPAGASALALGDLDADGDLDLLAATSAGDRVYLNDGSGAFTLAATFGSASAPAVALADFDLDGDLDVLVAGANAALWLNNGSASFTIVAAYVAADRLALGDFDADGRTDFATARAGQPARLYVNGGGGNFTQLGVAPGGGLPTLAAGDIDGDGRADLVLADATGSAGAWLTSAALASTRAPGQPALAFGSAAELADLDGDGALDLFGLTADGQPAASLYRLTATRTDEDTDVTLAAAGFTPSAANVHIVSLPAHGTLLTAALAPVSVADSFTAAQAATLVYQPAADFFGLDSFTWSASSGGAAHPHWLLVNPVTDNITANADTLAIAQGATSSAPSVLANDVNTEAGPFVASLVQPPAHGTVNLLADGTYTYAHDDSETRADAFTYRATNTATGRSADAVVTIIVTNVNAAPAVPVFSAANAPVYTGQAAGIVVGSLSATDPDPEDAGLLTYSFATGAGDTRNADFILDGATLKTAATLNVADGLIRSVRLRATDPAGLSTDRVLLVALTRAPEALVVTHTPAEDSVYSFNLTGAGGSTALAYEVLTQPVHGTLSGTAPALVYTPEENYHGSDSFTFRVADANLTSAAATVTLDVASVNDDPTVEGQSVSTNEDTPVTFTVTGADVDGDSLGYAVSTVPNRGLVSISGNQITYTPTANAHGSDAFALYAYDGNNGTSRDVFISVNVASVPDAPAFSLDSPAEVGLLKGTAYAATATMSDGDDDAVEIVIVSAPAHGTLSIADTVVTYVPAAGYAGADSYSVAASDGTLQSASATVALVINDPAPDAFSETIQLAQRGTAVWYLQGKDPQLDAVEFDILTPVAHGTTSIEYLNPNAQGVYRREVTYHPEASFFGTDTLVYVARDANGNVSAPATLTFEVARDNLLPVATASSSSRSGLTTTFTVNLAGTDPEGEPLTYRLLTLPAHGTLTRNDGSDLPSLLTDALPAPATLTYTPNTIPYAGTDSFTYVVNDGEDDSAPATVSLEFLRDTRAPVAGDDTLVVYRGFTETVDVFTNDFDQWGEELHLVSVTQGEHGAASIVGAGADARIIYAHNGDDATVDTFTYTVANESGDLAEMVGVQVFINDRDITVLSAADNGPGTLRAALEIVNRFHLTPAAGEVGPANWTIRVFPGNYGNAPLEIATVGDSDALLGDSYFLVEGNVVIENSGDPEVPLVLAPTAYAAPARLFRVAPGASLTLRNFALSGGIARHGGAIYNAGVLAVENSVLSDNAAIASDDGSEPGLGGALFNRNGTVTLTDTVLEANLADDAGGLYQIADGPGENALATFAGATFSGHGAARDFRSVSLNDGTSTIVADALSAESPTAPWFAPIADATVRSHFSATVPILLNAGQMLATVPDVYAVSGAGATRTLSVDLSLYGFDNPHTVIVDATGAGTVFRRSFTVTTDPDLVRAPVARDDHFVITTADTAQVLNTAVNDSHPDGLSFEIVGYSTPNYGYLATDPFGHLVYTPYGAIDGREDSFTYTIQSGGVDGPTSTATVSVKFQTTEVDVTDAASLRDAVAAANLNSTQAWTIRLPAELSLDAAADSDLFLGDSALLVTGTLVIDGSALESAVIRRADEAPAFRLIRVAHGASLTLRGLTLENGSALLGGAIYNEGELLLDEVVLQDNTAHLGGAIYTDSATLDVIDSVLLSNSATDISETDLGLGGAIYQRDGTVSLVRATVEDNSANNGGGLYAEGISGATATFVDSVLNNSSASADLAATGNVAFHRTHSSIARIDGPSVGAMNDINLNVYTIEGVTYTESVAFYTDESVPGLSISTSSSNQHILPDSGIGEENVDGFRKLIVAPAASGFTDVAITASSGGVSFSEHFRLSVYTGAVANPTAYTHLEEVYPSRSVVIDPIAGTAPATDPNGLPLTITAVGTPAHGTAVITSDNKIRYTHTGAEFPVSDTFAYTIDNGFGGTATSSIRVDVVQPTRTVTSIYELNDALAYVADFPDLPWLIVIPASATGQTWTTTQTFDNVHYGASNDPSVYAIVGNVTLDASAAPGFTLAVKVEGPPNTPGARHFVVQPGASLTLKSLKLTGGSSYAGIGSAAGGSVLNYGTFAADHVVFQSNRSFYANGQGGALYNAGGTATLADCSFVNNLATTDGGAIYTRNGSLTLVRVTFSGNTASVADDLFALGDGLGETATVVFTETPLPAASFFTTANGGAISVPGIPLLAVSDTVTRTPGQAFKIPLAGLLANDIGATGSTLAFPALSAGGVPIARSGGSLIYKASAAFNDRDSFTYTLTSSGGAISTGTVTILVQAPPPVPTETTLSIEARVGGGVILHLVGVPGRLYTIQVSTNLADPGAWTELTTVTADAQGRYTVEDPEPPAPARFYRAAYNR